MKVELETAEESYGDRNVLRIEWDDGDVDEELDQGEPEDNSFTRDYRWVKGAIERAYRDGIAAGVRGI
jgi:hypothetical protein